MALTKVGRSLLNTGVADSSDATAITISSAEDATFAGHILLADSKNVKIGAGTDLQLYHDGTNSYITNSTGALKIATETSGIAVTIGHTTSETTIADNLTVTGTVAAGVITADGLDMGDSEKIRLGAAQDLEIYHDGSHSYIYDGGTGNIVLKTNNGANVDIMGASEYMAKFIKDGAVELYYNDAKKLETTSAGITVTGAVTGNLTGDVTGDVSGTATVATTVTITDNESTNEENAVIFTAGGDVDGGNLGLESDGNLTYNPSSGTLTATALAGTLSTAAQTNITSVGTLTSLAITGDLDIADTGAGAITVGGTTNTYSAPVVLNVTDIGLAMSDGTKTLATWATHGGSSHAGSGVGTRSDHDLAILTNDTKRMIFDTSGNVGLGVVPEADWRSTCTALDIGSLVALWEGGADSTILANNIYEHTDTNRKHKASGYASYIQQYQGNIYFNNTTSGSADATISESTRMTIAQDGKVGIGCTPGQLLTVEGATPQIEFRNTANSLHTFTFVNSSATSSYNDIASIGAEIDSGNAKGRLVFRTRETDASGAQSERMRISNAGLVCIGDTAGYSGGHDAVSRMQISGGGSVLGIRQTQVTDASHRVVQVFTDNGGTYRGRITINNSATLFTSASDYRLKENVETLPNGLDRLKQLKPVKFKWKEHDYTSEGFIAHEVQEIYPDAVVGEKDADTMQSMDYGKITQLLVKAIQEQQTIIDDLKSRIETLEG